MLFRDYIWDFDGTLYDSYPRMIKAYRKVLSTLGFDIQEDELLKKAKVSLRSAAIGFAEALNIDISELMRKMVDYERSVAEPLEPYPGAREVCEAIVANGGRNFLYTHRNLGAREALEYSGMLHLFTDLVTSEDNFPNKPAPDAILSLIEKHGIDQARAVMVGDRNIDIEAGLNAGIEGCLFDAGGFYDDYEVKYRVHALSEMFGVMGIEQR